MPEEVVLEILTLHVHGTDGFDDFYDELDCVPNTDPAPKNPQHILMQVCKSWCKLVANAPLLWSRLLVVRTRCYHSKIERQLLRSKELKIQKVWLILDGFLPAGATILSSSYRWQNLHIRCRYDDTTPLIGNLGALEELRFSDFSYFSKDFFHPRPPKFRTIGFIPRVPKFSMPGITHYSTHRSLCIRGRNSEVPDIITTLNMLPDLTHCTLLQVEHNYMNYTEERFISHRITHLTISVLVTGTRSILPHFDFPHLQSLTVIHYPDTDDLFDFLRRSSDQLTHLAVLLNNIPNIMSIPIILQQCDDVTCLELGRGQNSFSEEKFLAELLCYDHYLPKLDTLVLSDEGVGKFKFPDGRGAVVVKRYTD